MGASAHSTPIHPTQTPKDNKMIDIATVPGSAFTTVQQIVAHLNRYHVRCRLQVIRNRRDLENAAHADRVLLLGGTDISPDLYGQRPTYAQWPDHDRDVIEYSLATMALEFGVPTLGICRGHQMLAVAAGGTLWQDLRHEAGIADHSGPHRLLGVRGPLLNWLPTEQVNSLHHQAVRDMPAGFEPVAYSPDGVIEAIYADGFLGVQWHPEMLWPNDRRWTNFFRWFVEDGLAESSHPKDFVPMYSNNSTVRGEL
jgi:putative glutamine amidotransferase